MKKTKVRSVEGLLADESFIAWLHQSDENAVCELNEWIISDAKNGQIARKAIRLLKQIQVKEKNIPDEQINAAAARLLKNITKKGGY